VTADDGAVPPAPTNAAPSPGSSPSSTRGAAPPALSRAGRIAWALVGIAVLLVLVWYVASAAALVLVPLVIALFPATLLAPISEALCRRGVPDALAAFLGVLVGVVIFFGILGAVIAMVITQMSDLLDSAAQGVAELENLLRGDPLGIGVSGLSDLIEMGREQFGSGGVAGQAGAAASAAAELLAGFVLTLVVLFFYLKDGRRFRDALVSTAPTAHRPLVAESLDRSWTTLAGYVHGQLIVAAVDAIFIGAGLLILGVPLAVPLAGLVLFGALFPIVGSITAGSLAVLVGLAHGGLVTGLIVLAIVVGVQQIEGNVLQPLILGRVLTLHPLVVLLAVTAGAVILGVLGAFLAVPLAAIAAQVIDLLRHPENRRGAPDAA
jgi:predicted PurR-regulated permease PerM